MTEKKMSSALTPAMKIVIGVVTMLVLAGAIVVATLWNAGSAQDASTSATSSSNDTDPAGTSPEGPAATTPGAASSPSHGLLPQATPTTGSEVLPPTATPDPRLPKVTPPKPLAHSPLPKSGSKNGGLVAGFPARIMGPTAGSHVVSSSIATERSVMQVGLVAISRESRNTISKHYKSLWASLGMRPSVSPPGTPSDTVTYTGKYESATLTFGTSGTGNQYALFGVFHTK